MVDRIGQQLGNYRLTRKLGEGGFAEVYLGEHIHLGTQAAIKVLHTQLTSDDVDKFRTEARTIARLIHPHIVRVLDFGVEGKTPFLVMDYAPNGTLRHRHSKGTLLPLNTIVDYVKQVANALQYAHDEKVIHRDIKPENMLLGRRNDILLSDFGIALVAQSSRYQSAQEMAGTMAYMAPEQIQGKPRPASDQYALGIVIYEWISGDRPFLGSLTELVGQHLAVSPPSLQEKVSMISPEVDQVVLTALAKDPKQRFVSVQAFATALEQACQLTPPASPVIAPPLGQSPLPNIVAASLSQTAPSADVVAAIPSSQLSQPTDVVTPPSQSSQPIKTATPLSQSQQSSVATTPPTAPIASPVASLTHFLSSSGSQLSKRRLSRRTMVAGLAGLAIAGGSITWLAFSQRPHIASPSFRPTPTLSPTPSPTPTASGQPLKTALYTYRGISGSGFFVSTLAWSPNGRRIASGSNDATVQVWDAVDGAHVLVIHDDGAIDVVAWSPDGSRIATGNEALTAQVWDAAMGTHFLTYHIPDGYVIGMSWSPDSKRIASGSNDTTVQVWDATTGAHFLTYSGHSDAVFSVAWSPDSKRIASGSNDTTVQVWDAATGKTLYTYTGHSSRVNTVTWSPDSTHIASGSDDMTIQVWDAATGKTLYTYTGHSSKVFATDWSPKGKRIASGSFDKTAQVWDAATGKTLYTYTGHSGPVFTLRWSPDGSRIASGGSDQTVQVWQVPG